MTEKQVKKLKYTEVVEIPAHYEVRGESGYGIFENKEDAIKYAKEENKKIEQKEKLGNSEDFFKIKLALFIEEQLGKYIEKLEKDLWHYRKYEGISKEEAEKIEEIRKILKEIINNLYKIYNGEAEVEWHESYFDHTTFYTIEKIDKERIKNFSTYNKIIEKIEKFEIGD